MVLGLASPVAAAAGEGKKVARSVCSFSVTVIKPGDRGSAQKEGFALAYGSRGIESVTMERCGRGGGRGRTGSLKLMSQP